MTKRLTIFLLLSLIPMAAGAEAAPDRTDGPRILLLVDDGVGYNYFELRETLQDMGFAPVTVSLSTRIGSCSNREDRDVPIDLYLRDFDYGTFRDFEALIIPSGGHYALLSHSRQTREFLSRAYEEGLLLGAIGTGPAVLASVPGLLQDVKVSENAFFGETLKSAGAKVVCGKVAYDQSILTGSTGGGKTGSAYTGAPVQEFCEKLAEVLK